MTDEALFELWKVHHTKVSEDERSDDLHYESMAVGFAMAHGKTLDEAFNFYNDCIEKDVF